MYFWVDYSAYIKELADTLKKTVQTKTVDNLKSKTERKRIKNHKFA